ISGTACSKGNTWNVEGSGIAILTDSEIREKPSIDEPSKPTPSSNADSSSEGLITTDFNPPMRSVNHNRIKRISRSSTVRRTNSCWLLMVLTLVETVHPSCGKPSCWPNHPRKHATAATVNLYGFSAV